MTRVRRLACWTFLKIPYWVREKRSSGRRGELRQRFEGSAQFETEQNHYGAKDRDIGRNRSRRLRACVSPGEGRGTHPDRLARGVSRASDRKTFARTNWRQRANRRPGQSFRCGCVRCGGTDCSLLRRRGTAQAIEERVEAGNDSNRYHGAFGGDDWRRTDARARCLARLCSPTDA